MSLTPVASSSSQPSRSLNRQVVLDEDEYTEALSHIIARDFFPSLVHLDATNDYLDALRSNDPALINSTVRRLEELNTPLSRRGWETPAQTPYRAGPSETPLRTPRTAVGGEPPTKRARYDTDMSLDAFQARYTSEDNASFTEILEDENKKRKEKYGWAWEAQRRVEEQKNRMLEDRERLMIEAPAGPGVRERFLIETPTPVGLITAGPEDAGKSEESGEGKEAEGNDKDERDRKGKEVSIRPKEPEEPVDVMAPKKDTRPAGVDGWKFRARNALMFMPDADVTPYQPPVSKIVPDAKSEPKVIKYNNTRLPEQDDGPSTSSISEPPSPTRSRIDAAIAGTPYRPRSPNGSDFGLVPSVPSPSPSELGPAAVKQLMTWGTITATPRVISQSDDPAESSMPPPSTPFRIAEPTSRERLSHKLSSNASKSLRAKAGMMNLPGVLSRTPSTARKGSMPPPSWTPRRAEAAGNLTPAARRLLDRTTMGTAASRRADAMGKLTGWEGSGTGKEKDLNKVRWTPSPATRRRG
ncbi:hypothetical protein K474DRAFT_1704802 [Panus rudis PR-1116 ss-1]|nr:hypothetical protein K474DRAFT_1704802 [Panus rudis PR-1116 ss-1]